MIHKLDMTMTAGEALMAWADLPAGRPDAERDALERRYRVLAEAEDKAERSGRDVMTPPPICWDDEAPRVRMRNVEDAVIRSRDRAQRSGRVVDLNADDVDVRPRSLRGSGVGA